MSKASDLTGQTFGDYTALRRAPNLGHRAAWVCECSACDEEHTVLAQGLKSGRSNRCPTNRPYVRRVPTPSGGRHRDIPGVIDDATPSEMGGREHMSWRRILQVCLCPEYADYPNYGGAGVQIDPSWMRYSTYRADLGPCPSDKHSLSRLDLDYGPGLCAWLTRKEQARLRSTAVLIEYDGESKCLRDWADLYGLAINTLWSRLDAGWPLDRALTEPTRPQTIAVEHQGKSYSSLTAATQDLDLSYGMVRQRLAAGWPLDRALSEQPYPHRLRIEHQGKVYFSLAEAARDHGLYYPTVLSRYQEGWPMDRILSTPTRGNST